MISNFAASVMKCQHQPEILRMLVEGIATKINSPLCTVLLASFFSYADVGRRIIWEGADMIGLDMTPANESKNRPSPARVAMSMVSKRPLHVF